MGPAEPCGPGSFSGKDAALSWMTYEAGRWRRRSDDLLPASAVSDLSGGFSAGRSQRASIQPHASSTSMKQMMQTATPARATKRLSVVLANAVSARSLPPNAAQTKKAIRTIPFCKMLISMSSTLLMFDPSKIPLLVALCSALAAAGAFAIQFRRLTLERAALVVTSGVLSQDNDIFTFTLMNVGGRPAYDVEVSCSGVKPDYFVEGIEAGGSHEAAVSLPASQAKLYVTYSDRQSGRVADVRQITADDGGLRIGKREAGKRLAAGDSHALLPKAADKPD